MRAGSTGWIDREGPDAPPTGGNDAGSNVFESLDSDERGGGGLVDGERPGAPPTRENDDRSAAFGIGCID